MICVVLLRIQQEEGQALCCPGCPQHPSGGAEWSADFRKWRVCTFQHSLDLFNATCLCRGAGMEWDPRRVFFFWGGGGERELYHTVSVTTRMNHWFLPCLESPLHVSLIVRGRVTRQCPQTTAVDEKGDLKQGICLMSSDKQTSLAYHW